MKRVTIDLILDASEEAKICLNFDKRTCRPHNCKRLIAKKKELKRKGDKNESIPTSD